MFRIVSIFDCDIYIYISQTDRLDYILTTKQVVDFFTQNAFFGGLVAVILQIHIIIIFISYISIYYTFITINFYMYIYFIIIWNT